MLLITELQEDVQLVVEEKDDKKSLFIEGVFMVAGRANKNNRLYSESVMAREVSRYSKELVEAKRAVGELNHPSGPNINLDRVSHLIEKLEMKKDGTVWGRAKILETPMGSIVKGLLEGGVTIGVSSRGLGSLTPKGGIMEVQDDFKLVTAADIVADPSAPGAFVQGIMENVEWYFDESAGAWLAEKCHDARKSLKKMPKKQLEERQLAFFESFLNSLNS